MTKVFILDCNVFSTPAQFDLCFKRMNAERKKKIESLKFEKDKFLSLGSGVLLERALSECGIDYKTAKLKFSEFGKPFLESENIFFNLSHSGHFAVCAVSENEVGIDIEEIKPIEEDVIKSVCSDSEFERFSSIKNDDERLKEFYRIWTKKESYLKMKGEGIDVIPSTVEESVFFHEYDVPDYCLTVCARQNDFAKNLTEIKLI